MESLFTPIPISLLLLLLVQFMATVVFIWLLNKFAIIFIRGSRSKKQALFYIPILRNFIGLCYIIYAVYMLLPYQPVFVLFIMISLLLLNWKMLQNFAQGTTYRLVRGNLVDSPMQVGDYYGKVIAMSDLHLTIQTSLGQVVQIPYTKVVQSVVIKTTEKEKTEVQNLTVTMPKKEIAAHILKDKLIEKLISFPWVMAHQPIEVIIEEKNDKDMTINMSYILEDITKADYITSEIEQFLEDL